ncbi:chemotaxis protein CheW [Geomobilimonas luticola]|uniref:Chemotaxis protein CheW n=1 Tax=Geomobilimonas luticola TaxID=1114878 RepID=A0ABS5S807_9BACT|nr:chemotaxis protein CheW [Geomobilimonas luticola]MBT0651510.1 chemotaxis protein CheW [Geomobilimonas luticola]
MKASSRGFLVFTLQGERYGLSLQDVLEVMDPSLPVPVPRAPEFIRGVVNVHGNLVAVLDLARLFARGEAVVEGKFLVLDRRIANLALWVDGVEGFVAEEAGTDPPADGLIARVVRSGTGTIRILALDRLVERVEEQLKR